MNPIHINQDMPEEHDNNSPQQIDWFLFAFGFFLIIFAFLVMDDPILPAKGGVKIDIRPFQIPLAVVSAGVGGYSLYLSLSKKHTDNILACSKCNKHFERKNTYENKCPDCENELESLEGFYDRHPELKK